MIESHGTRNVSPKPVWTVDTGDSVMMGDSVRGTRERDPVWFI